MLKWLANKKIAIDIDDVLSLTVRSFLEFLKECHEIDMHYDEFTNYRAHELDAFRSKNIDEDGVYSLWIDFSSSHIGKQMEIIEWSSDGLRRLLQEWYELTLITARNESLRDYTQNWLNLRFPDIDFSWIHFTGGLKWAHIKKSVICKQHWIGLMIEDNAENVIELAENWIKSYLFTKPWNKHHTIDHPYIKRIDSWGEIQ
ncbi:MAG: hypothetical protein ACD_2C00128G0002 [uncultured bacterium (gcode 4)]|uniref:Uncharacterized protein n=1 Tax=uncultured bacterium (gcode 4) TaxID=1234023 RepID=K2GGZ7_9BACT|nr:MAG: hypothetical protein ACD_2C00128G0002 [uncultured bacterium (gcode 4)]